MHLLELWGEFKRIHSQNIKYFTLVDQASSLGQHLHSEMEPVITSVTGFYSNCWETTGGAFVIYLGITIFGVLSQLLELPVSYSLLHCLLPHSFFSHSSCFCFYFFSCVHLLLLLHFLTQFLKL